jgi:hypothetical protein
MPAFFCQGMLPEQARNIPLPAFFISKPKASSAIILPPNDIAPTAITYIKSTKFT